MLSKVKQIYPSHTIIGLDQVFYPNGGWKCVKVREGSNENKLNGWLSFYKGWGVTDVSFLLQDETGRQFHSDFKINELC